MNTSWSWKSCIAAAILAAGTLGSTSAHAQSVTVRDVVRATVDANRTTSSINRFGQFPLRTTRIGRCHTIYAAVAELNKLRSLSQGAAASGVGELFLGPLRKSADDLAEAIESYYQSYYDDDCDPPYFAGGGGSFTAGGGAGGGPRSTKNAGFWFGFQFSEVRLGLDWSRSQGGNGNNPFNPFNQFPIDNLPSSGSASRDPLGIGMSVGYTFAPWSNVLVSPFVSVDYLNMSVAQTFPGGSLVGTTSNFAMTGGVKAGPQLPNGLWLYGIAGASVLNEKLNVVIAPLSSSTRVTVPGATVGVGGAIKPSFLQGFGMPVSVFAEYQHTWWQDANVFTPAASPLFNYNFRRQDDALRFGFTLALQSPAPAASTPSYPVKALPPK